MVIRVGVTRHTLKLVQSNHIPLFCLSMQPFLIPFPLRQTVVAVFLLPCLVQSLQFGQTLLLKQLPPCPVLCRCLLFVCDKTQSLPDVAARCPIAGIRGACTRQSGFILPPTVPQCAGRNIAGTQGALLLLSFPNSIQYLSDFWPSQVQIFLHQIRGGIAPPVNFYALCPVPVFLNSEVFTPNAVMVCKIIQQQIQVSLLDSFRPVHISGGGGGVLLVEADSTPISYPVHVRKFDLRISVHVIACIRRQ